MAKQTVKRRDWTKEDVRTLKTLAREKTKTTVIARRLKRSVGATYQQASKLGVAVVLGADGLQHRAVELEPSPHHGERRIERVGSSTVTRADMPLPPGSMLKRSTTCSF